jgi:hypothetical protein
LIPGILLAWRLSDLPALRDNRTLLRLSGYAFFLYLLHEPTLSYIISSSVYVFVPGGTVTGIVYYVLIGGLTVAVVLGLGSLLARFAPPVYGLLTGFGDRPRDEPLYVADRCLWAAPEAGGGMLRLTGGDSRAGTQTAEAKGCAGHGRVRESLFSILGSMGVDWPGCRVLDLFAGQAAWVSRL